MEPFFNVGESVAFQFGSLFCEGTITKFITPLRAEVLVHKISVFEDGEMKSEETEQIYEVDAKDLFLNEGE